jgi:hypothetical protein
MENRGKFRECANYGTAQTNTELVAAPAAGTRLYVTDVVLSAGANAGEVRLLNGSGGSVIVGPVWLPANGALAHHFGVAARLDQATALCLTSQGVTTHSVTVHGYVQ